MTRRAVAIWAVALLAAGTIAVAARTSPDESSTARPGATTSSSSIASSSSSTTDTPESSTASSSSLPTTPPVTSSPTTVPTNASIGGSLLVWEGSDARSVVAIDPTGHRSGRLHDTFGSVYFDASPDSMRLAGFELVDGNRWEIVLRNGDGTAPRVLTSAGDGIDGEHPIAWRPDGAAITTMRDDASLVDIDPTTGAVTVLAEPDADGGPDGGWSWSPDSSRVAYVVAPSAAGILTVLDVGTGERRSHRVGALSPAWSPDGRWIAHIRYDSSSNDPYQLWMLDVESDEQHLALGGLSRFTKPVWSPAGDSIAVATFADDRVTVTTVRVDGSGVRPVSSPIAGEVHSIEWAPTGNAVAFTEAAFDGPPVECCGRAPQQHYTFHVRIVRADGGDERRYDAPRGTIGLGQLVWVR